MYEMLKRKKSPYVETYVVCVCKCDLFSVVALRKTWYGLENRMNERLRYASNAESDRTPGDKEEDEARRESGENSAKTRSERGQRETLNEFRVSIHIYFFPGTFSV